MRQLFEIEDVFEISDRGCVLVPGVPRDFPGSVKAGAVIVIEPPSGKGVETTIAAFEMGNRGSHSLAFSVPPKLRKDQLPIGSRVLLREKPLVEYKRVRIRKLVLPPGDYDNWGVNQREPSVGETGTFIDLLSAEGLPPKYLVENCDTEGIPIWLSEFLSEEIEALDEPSA